MLLSYIVLRRWIKDTKGTGWTKWLHTMCEGPYFHWKLDARFFITPVCVCTAAFTHYNNSVKLFYHYCTQVLAVSLRYINKKLVFLHLVVLLSSWTCWVRTVTKKRWEFSAIYVWSQYYLTFIDNHTNMLYDRIHSF